MKILVTGATGLVGINLVRRLIKAGHDVRILLRKSSQTWPLDGLPLEKAYGDITKPSTLRSAVDGCEVVFHVAGYVNISPFVRHHTESINVEGVRHIVTACLDAGVKRLVHTSSIAAIGYGSPDNPATENSEWNFKDLNNPYCDSKYEGEQVVLQAVRNHSLDAVVVNPGYIIGPWDIRPTSGRMLIMIAKGKVPVYPLGGISLAPVDAVVDGHINALIKGKTGERYILGGDNLTYLDIMKLMATITKAKTPKLPLDPRLTWPVGFLGGLLGRIWPHTFADINNHVMRIGRIGHYVSSDKARKELDYQPASAQQAIQTAYDWFVEYKYLAK